MSYGFTGGSGVLIFVAVLAGIGLIYVAIRIWICWILYSCFKRIPQTFREMEPGLVWLLLIPLFNVVWIFFVYPRLSKSFKAYFLAAGDSSVDDCGESLGWVYAILVAVSIVFGLAWLAALVVLIIYLVKVSGLKNRVTDSPVRLRSDPDDDLDERSAQLIDEPHY